jgi:hypothetical protein
LQNYFLTLKTACDQSMTATELRDEFIISNEEGLPLFEIIILNEEIIFLNDKNQNESMTCKQLSNVSACDLYQISDGHELCYKIYEMLCALMQLQECEFFSEVFDESNQEYPLLFLQA